MAADEAMFVAARGMFGKRVSRLLVWGIGVILIPDRDFL